AHIDVVNLLGLDAGAVDGLLDDDGAQVSGRGGGQGAAKLADGGAAGRCNDDLLHVVSLLFSVRLVWTDDGLCIPALTFYQNPIGHHPEGLLLVSSSGAAFSASYFARTAFSTLGVTNLLMSLP